MPRIYFPNYHVVIVALVLLSTLRNATRPQTANAGGLGPVNTTLAYPVPPLYAKSAALLDVDTGQWLRLLNADVPLPMASTTKIMTALLAIENGHLQDLVKISNASATIGETTMGLVAGERIRMLDLLYGLLIPSGNDAAIAIAEEVGGSQRKFVAMMNARARALHLSHTHFTNAYGFSDTASGDDPMHYSSARDLVILASYAMRSPVFRNIVGTSTYDVPATAHNADHYLTTVNYFMTWYPGADGVKPGWTSGAGICQVVDVRRNGRHLLAAVMHTPNTFTDMRDLMNYATGDFTWYQARAADGSLLIDDKPAAYVQSGSVSAPEWYFPFTGHAVQGAFLNYYRAHGGFSVFGAPRTEPVNVGGSIVQFFSNQVLAFNPLLRAVMPQRLGFGAVPAADWLQRVPRVNDTPWRRFYRQTGHTVTYRFLNYFMAHGGVRTFGYPITEKRYESGTLVQYFENAEFVWHNDPNGYVTTGPLGLRSLVELGLAQGDNLPPALHSPFGHITPTSTAHRTKSPATRATSTSTPIPTVIPTAHSTATNVPTVTMLPTRITTPRPATPTHTPTLQAATPTHTPTPRLPTPTLTSTPTRAVTATSTSSATLTVTPTRRPSVSRTPTPAGTDTPVALVSP